MVSPSLSSRRRATSEAAYLLQQQTQWDAAGNLAKPLVADVHGNVSSHNDAHQSYALGKELGFGSFSTVRHGICRSSSTHVAVKRLTKSVSNSALLVNEIKTLQRVQGHPNVVNLISTSEDNDSLFLTTALCPNGSLFDYIVINGPVPEHVARQWAYELFDALRHCHERGVVNRDLKPENILLDDAMSLVIADFGLAAIVENAEARNLVTATGSPVFAAPEVHRAQKAAYSGGPADMFSAGCVLHCCLAGELPFDVDTYTTEWAGYQPPEHVSAQCHELLCQLLNVDPARRPTAANALQSEWVRGRSHSHSHRARLLMAPAKPLPM